MEPNAGFVKQLKKWGENGYEWGEQDNKEYNAEEHYITDIYQIGYETNFFTFSKIVFAFYN